MLASMMYASLRLEYQSRKVWRTGLSPSVPAALNLPNDLKAVCNMLSEKRVGPSSKDTSAGAAAGLCSVLGSASTACGKRVFMITSSDSSGELVICPSGRLTSPRQTLCCLKAPLQNLAISAGFRKEDVIFFQDALLALLISCLYACCAALL